MFSACLPLSLFAHTIRGIPVSHVNLPLRYTGLTSGRVSGIDSTDSTCAPPEENEEALQMKHAFRRFAAVIATATGSPWAFMIAVLIILAWGVSGPLFHFSDTWQLVINTSTTIITFLMVFLIQNTQNRDAVAIQLKLDELLRSVVGARTSLVDLENLSDEDILLLRQQFAHIHDSAAQSEKEAAVNFLEESDPARHIDTAN